MKLSRVLVVCAVLALVATMLSAQEPAGETFLEQLRVNLAENGWSDIDTRAFMRAAEELDWAGTGRADPQIVAWALEKGMSEEALATQERAQLALALAIHTAQMTRLGYASQDVAASASLAARIAVQELVQARTRAGEDGAGEMVQNRIMTSIEEQARRTVRVRSAEAAGNTYRIGEADPGVPLQPDGPPMPGEPAGPAGPGTGDADGPSGPNS
jgi:hypothetical protein